MKLQIKVNEAGVIEDAKFKTYGCGSAIASSSLVTEWVKGKTVDQALEIKNTQIAEELALPPVKIHCSILAEDAHQGGGRGLQEEARRLRRAASCLIGERLSFELPRPALARRGVAAATMITMTEKGGEARRPLPRSAAAGAWACAWAWKNYRLLGLGVQARVCGRSYSPRTRSFETHGVKVIVDPKKPAVHRWHRTGLRAQGLNEGFRFNNPNVKDECGCGESFRLV